MTLPISGYSAIMTTPEVFFEQFAGDVGYNDPTVDGLDYREWCDQYLDLQKQLRGFWYDERPPELVRDYLSVQAKLTFLNSAHYAGLKGDVSELYRRETGKVNL
jgi:hypothetical protein